MKRNNDLVHKIILKLINICNLQHAFFSFSFFKFFSFERNFASVALTHTTL